jgi:hypothetical protein
MMVRLPPYVKAAFLLGFAVIRLFGLYSKKRSIRSAFLIALRHRFPLPPV